jgi:hypothetical protein
MSKRCPVVIVIAVLLGLPFVMVQSIQAQWPQTPPQQPYGGQPQYPPPQAQFPAQSQVPSGQSPYPGIQSPFPSPQAQIPSPPSGMMFQDALGRFKASLPHGTMPMGATYSFGLPAMMCQASIMVLIQDQMFQTYTQNFNNMLQQMGARIDSEQQLEINGRQARRVAATLKDQMSGTSMASINVFISGVNVWIQVMAPEQNAQGLQQALQSILSGLQF